MNYINPDAPAAGLTRLLNMRDNNPAMQLAYIPTKDIAVMGRMGGLEFNPYSGIPQARGVAAVAEGGSIDEAPLSPMADELASRGRYGDSMLLHVRPDELQGLASLGTLTINPDTGLPEAFSFKSLLPAVGAIAGSILLGPGIGTAIGSSAFGVGIGAGIGSFAGGLAAGQSPGQAALGGLISGATAGFFSGAPTGVEALGPGSPALASTPAELAAEGVSAGVNPGVLGSTTAAQAGSTAAAAGLPVGSAGVPDIGLTGFGSGAVADPLIAANQASIAAQKEAAIQAIARDMNIPLSEAANMTVADAYHVSPLSKLGKESLAIDNITFDADIPVGDLLSFEQAAANVPSSNVANANLLDANLGMARFGGIDPTTATYIDDVSSNVPFAKIGPKYEAPSKFRQFFGADDLREVSNKNLGEGLLTRQEFIDAGGMPAGMTLQESATQTLTNPKTYVGAGISTLMQPPPPMEYEEPEPLEFGSSYVPRRRTLAGGQQRDPETTEQILARMISGGDAQPLTSPFRYISTGGLVALQEGGIPTQGQPVVGSTVLEEQEKAISERARQDEIKQRDKAMSRGQQFIQQPTGNDQLFQQMQIAGEALGQQLAQGQQGYATPYGQKAPTASFNTGADFGFNTGGLVGLEEGGKLAPRPRENPINVINNLPQEELYKRMVVREAGNQGLLGMALVARSIDNRFKTLNQSDKIKPSLFGAKDKTIRGILLGDKQYSPVKDFSAARELTDSEEAAAMEAISLSKDVGGLSNLLQKKGYDEDQIFKLLNSTGFRRYDAEYDKSQEVNTEGFGEHIFNMAGNPKGKYKNIEEVKAKPKFEDVPFNKAFPSVIGKEYMEMMQKLYDNLPKKAEGGGIGGYFEGQVQGRGDGMSDQILFEVEGNNPDKALLSRDEYVIPADVVAMLGNGSSNAGSDQLDNFIKGVRQDSFGTQKQQRELNAQQGLRGLV
jgi:hypothetical protein